MNIIKNKKGISPVIATVLLIAMVVAISLIIFIWFRSLMKETVTKFEGENIELACDKVAFDASYSGGTLYISNTGNVPIYSLNVKTSSGVSHETKNIKDLSSNWPETGLNSGGDFSDEITLDGSVTVSPILLGVSGGEEKTYECDINKYGIEAS